MDPRPPAEEIIKGLTATADKIRASAQANYDRPKSARLWVFVIGMSEMLLVRSGIPRGLRTEIEAKREPVEVDASPPSRVDTSWEVLMDAGLQLLCEWTLDSERLIKLEERTNCM